MFVSYSHENAAWYERLLPVLRVKANVDTLQPWHDTELKAEDRWDKEIRAELDRMDIFLLGELSISRLRLHPRRGTAKSQGAPQERGRLR
jgi:hypothetical protein